MKRPPILVGLIEALIILSIWVPHVLIPKMEILLLDWTYITMYLDDLLSIVPFALITGWLGAVQLNRCLKGKPSWEKMLLTGMLASTCVVMIRLIVELYDQFSRYNVLNRSVEFDSTTEMIQFVAIFLYRQMTLIAFSGFVRTALLIVLGGLCWGFAIYAVNTTLYKIYLKIKEYGAGPRSQ